MSTGCSALVAASSASALPRSAGGAPSCDVRAWTGQRPSGTSATATAGTSAPPGHHRARAEPERRPARERAAAAQRGVPRGEDHLLQDGRNPRPAGNPAEAVLLALPPGPGSPTPHPEGRSRPRDSAVVVRVGEGGAVVRTGGARAGSGRGHGRSRKDTRPCTARSIHGPLDRCGPARGAFGPAGAPFVAADGLDAAPAAASADLAQELPPAPAHPAVEPLSGHGLNGPVGLCLPTPDPGAEERSSTGGAVRSGAPSRGPDRGGGRRRRPSAPAPAAAPRTPARSGARRSGRAHGQGPYGQGPQARGASRASASAAATTADSRPGKRRSSSSARSVFIFVVPT